MMKRPPKRHRIQDRKAAAPFLLTESDPTNFWGDDKPKEKKPRRTIKVPVKFINTSKPKKVLTNLKPFARLRNVIKANKKGDKIMATDKQKTSTKNGKKDTVLSIAWLVEAAFRGFVGWVLLSNFDHLATTAAAFYALGTAGVIVVSHFVRAHR
jgi:hypothetical protein